MAEGTQAIYDSSYEGEWKNGLRDGFGTHVFKCKFIRFGQINPNIQDNG